MSPSLASSMLSSNITDTYISIPLGIIIGLLASFVQSLGLTIQRKSHVLNQQLPEHEQVVEHRRPMWLLGFTIFISSNILGSLVQIASLPVVILAPLGAVSLLWNAFFARVLLGDVFSPWMILGTFLIAGGAVLIAIFGIVPEPTHSLEDLLSLFTRPPFVAYFSILGSVVFVALAISHIVEYSLSQRTISYDTPLVVASPTAHHVSLPDVPSTLTTGVTNAISEAMVTERTPLLLPRKDRKLSSASSTPSSFSSARQPDPSIQRTRLLLSISYSSFSGILSGMCLIFAKSGVELLMLTLRGHNQFWRWESWVLVLGLVFFALLQLWYLHRALVLANPTLVCPSAFCFYNISSIVNGLIYFDQFSAIPPLHLGLVVVGMAVLLSGVWVVSIQSDTIDDIDWSDEETGDDICLPQPLEGLPLQAAYRDHSDDEAMDAAVVERMAKSESNVTDMAPSLDHPNATHTLGLGRPSRRPISGTSSHNREADSTSPTTSSGRAMQPPDIVPPSHTSSSRASRPRGHRRRPTIDTVSPFHNYGDQTQRHLPHHANTLSHTSPPPLNAVTTLGAGFQIGLSPMSPGFSIVPRERHRRISGLVRDGSLERVENARRRTVSEGDFRPLDLPGHDVIAPPWSAEALEAGMNTPDSESPEGLHPHGSAGKGKGKLEFGWPRKERWKWLSGMFMSKR